MPDIFHDFVIRVPPERVFEAVSTPEGLERWWTRRSQGEAVEGGIYELGFGPGYDWRARVCHCVPGERIEWELTQAHEDWLGTRVGFELEGEVDLTQVRFYHKGWPEENEHFRISCYCWAMYLRILKRFLETGETVPYEDRLNV